MVISTPLMALMALLPMPSPQPLALEEMLILTMMRPSLSDQIPVSLLFLLCIVSLLLTNYSVGVCFYMIYARHPEEL